MMKSEPRPFASLSSGLLARKGAARPAMRPQGFGQLGSGLDDLGWNDMGFEAPKPVLAPVDAADGESSAPRVNPAAGLTPASPVHAVQEELVHRLVQDVEEDDLDETAEPVPADAPPLRELLAAATVPAEVPEPAEVRAEVPEPVPAPAPVVVAAEPKRSAKRSATSRPRAAVSAKGKAAFTLRLDAERHLKLRLACAVTGTSAQQLVTRALDELLGTMPELDVMARNAPERSANKG